MCIVYNLDATQYDEQVGASVLRTHNCKTKIGSFFLLVSFVFANVFAEEQKNRKIDWNPSRYRLASVFMNYDDNERKQRNDSQDRLR